MIASFDYYRLNVVFSHALSKRWSIYKIFVKLYDNFTTGEDDSKVTQILTMINNCYKVKLTYFRNCRKINKIKLCKILKCNDFKK